MVAHRVIVHADNMSHDGSESRSIIEARSALVGSTNGQAEIAITSPAVCGFYQYFRSLYSASYVPRCLAIRLDSYVALAMRLCCRIAMVMLR